jgi:hypothetical protein
VPNQPGPPAEEILGRTVVGEEVAPRAAPRQVVAPVALQIVGPFAAEEAVVTRAPKEPAGEVVAAAAPDPIGPQATVDEVLTALPKPLVGSLHGG